LKIRPGRLANQNHGKGKRNGAEFRPVGEQDCAFFMVTSEEGWSREKEQMTPTGPDEAGSRSTITTSGCHLEKSTMYKT
jgi:hypothetical protein